LEVLKSLVLISYFVQGSLNWRNNVIWLQLCLSTLANYQFFHLHTRLRKIPSVVHGYLYFVSSNQTEICLLFSLNRSQMSVHKPDAVQNGMLCSVGISVLEPSTCRTKHRPVTYLVQQSLQNKITARHAIFINSTAILIRHIFELVSDKTGLYCALF